MTNFIIEEKSPYDLIMKSDSYKIGMKNQYPSGITEVYSFIESRGGKFDEVVLMGVKSFCDRYLNNPLTKEDIRELEKFFELRPEPFDAQAFRALLDVNCGFLPLEIKALPEGTVVPVSVPMVTVKNTIPEAYWLTTLIETKLLSYVWYQTTVATLAREIKKKLKAANDKSSPDFQGIDFQLHNFGDRGAAPDDSAIYGGVAHLVSFMGTDSLAAVRHIQEVYREKGIFGYSVPASEHSIATAWGPDDGEVDYILHMIRTFKEKFDIISVVADSYDVFEFTKKVATNPEIRAELADLEARDKRFVFRPDSGTPKEVLKGMFDIIEVHFPVTINSAGYKVLPPYLGVLWGDGVNFESIQQILDDVMDLGWASQNVVLGMGGQLVQAGINRDTNKFAMKASNVVINGVEKGIAKDPITAAWKKSKKGKFSVIRDGGKLTWVEGENVEGDLLEVVYKDGDFFVDDNFADVKDRAKI